MTTGLSRAVARTSSLTAATLRASPSCVAQRQRLQDLQPHVNANFSRPCPLLRPGRLRLRSSRRLEHISALPGLPLLGIALTEESPTWTLDQIAGLVFGGIMLASVLLASKVDEYIARAQRRDLGLCEECGGLNEPETCDQNKCPYNKNT